MYITIKNLKTLFNLNFVLKFYIIIQFIITKNIINDK